MKKRFTLIVIAIFASITMFAQETSSDFVSKRGIQILPETGEYAIGINATPFFTYFGNMLNGNAANAAPTFGFTAAAPLTITGKKMVDANTAYRGIFRIGFTNDKYNEYVNDDTNTSTTPMFVTDSKSVSEMNIALGAGLEKRRGKGRLQGIYGAQAIFSLNTHSDKYTYGNAMTTTNFTPTTSDFAGNSGMVGSRTVTNKQGTTFGIAVQGFVGAEYFFAPKFSVSGELMYGLYFMSQGDGTLDTEQMNSAGTGVETITTNTGGESHFGLDTGVSGTLNLNFYF